MDTLKDFADGVKKHVKNWWVPMVIGILLIVLGCYVFTVPVASYVALSVVFSLSFLIVGIMELTFSIQNKGIIPNWGWNLAFGIIDVVLGILLLIHPEVSMQTLPFFIAFMVMFRSIGAIVSSFDMKDLGISDWGFVLTFGILGVLLSFILLYNPLIAGMTVVVYTGICLIVVGINSIYFSTKVKKFKDFTGIK